LEGHQIAHQVHQVEDQVLKGVPQVAEVLLYVEPEEELRRDRSQASNPAQHYSLLQNVSADFATWLKPESLCGAVLRLRAAATERRPQVE
jgi:hypothetical protein